jgi:hypothetical protein
VVVDVDFGDEPWVVAVGLCDEPCVVVDFDDGPWVVVDV